MNNIKSTSGYNKGEINNGVIPKQHISITKCVCHMIREMGDCKLNEVVKQIIKNQLW